jgi:hypothetical protein
MGEEPQLVMLLSGGAGCGKRLVIARAQEFCFLFCQSMGISFNKKTIYISSSSGSSAALLGGTTTHGAGYINRRRIKDEDRVGWKPVRIFVVNEVSFLKVKDMTELNKKLQNLREDTSKLFGGVSIFFLETSTSSSPSWGPIRTFSIRLHLMHCGGGIQSMLPSFSRATTDLKRTNPTVISWIA